MVLQSTTSTHMSVWIPSRSHKQVRTETIRTVTDNDAGFVIRCTDRDLLQPTALVDCVSVCVCASVALSSRCVFVCVSVSWCVNETESDNTDVASTCVLREY